MNKIKKLEEMMNKCIDRTSARKCPKWTYKLNIGSYPIEIKLNKN